MSKSIDLTNTLLSYIGDYEIKNIAEEKQNDEYEGASFHISDHKFRSRLAKLTPKKKGYFVAFWEKNATNQNQAYAYDESPDKIIVSVIDKELKGQFIFPRSVLLKQGVLRSDTAKGKMAMRVYPSWEKDLNKSATKTQAWQMEYFMDTSNEVDINRLIELYF